MGAPHLRRTVSATRRLHDRDRPCLKAREGRGRYSIGSEHKLGGADVHLGFEVVRKLHRGSTGLMRIVDHSFEFRHPAATTSTEAGFRPTVLMERLSRELQKHPEGLTRSKLYKATKGKREWLVKGLEVLIAEGFVEDSGSLLGSLRPFLVGNDGSLVAKPFPAVPDSHRDPGSPRPTGGDGNGNGKVDLADAEWNAKYADQPEVRDDSLEAQT